MGIVYYIIVIFMFFLFISIVLYTFSEKVLTLSKNGKLFKFISIIKNVYSSLKNYLSVHHIISLTSVTIYVYYEYVEKGCYGVYCFLSEREISETRLIKGEIIILIIFLIG